MRAGLGEVQRLLYRLITSPNGVEEGLVSEYGLPPGGLDAIISGDTRIGAVERVGIYADMYFYRLLDSFKEDFSATLKILGNVNFHNLITGYLAAYPPSQPSITDASQHLSAFAAASEWISQFPYVAELIRLERALIESPSVRTRLRSTCSCCEAFLSRSGHRFAWISIRRFNSSIASGEWTNCFTLST
jgi:Putative DNA-binding domain